MQRQDEHEGVLRMSRLLFGLGGSANLLFTCLVKESSDFGEAVLAEIVADDESAKQCYET